MKHLDRLYICKHPGIVPDTELLLKIIFHFLFNTIIYIYIYTYIYTHIYICSLFLLVLGLHCCMGFSLVVVSEGYSSLGYTGFSLQWLLLWSIGSQAHRLQ